MVIQTLQKLISGYRNIVVELCKTDFHIVTVTMNKHMYLATKSKLPVVT